MSVRHFTRFADLPQSPTPPFQSLTEFGALWEYVEHVIDPRFVVEIGSLYGGTLWYWLQLSDAAVASVDLVPPEPIRTDVLAARALWPSWSPRLSIIEGDSHDPQTSAAVTRQRNIDLLFIDGDHTYGGVRADFDLWSPLVRPGGLIAFHDTVVNGTRDEPGVRRLCEELKHQWGVLSVEFFDPDGAGITAFVLPLSS